MKRLTPLLRHSLFTLVGLGCATLGACKKKSDDDSETQSPYGMSDDDDLPSSGSDDGPSDEFGEDEEEEGDDELGLGSGNDDRWDKPLAKLPPRTKARKKCRGRGKRRKCKMVDPKPGISASYGVREFMGPFRFGMSPAVVIKRLSKDIDAEYKKRMEGVDDPQEQDRHRNWRRAEVSKIRENHVKFNGQNHRWSASIVQHDFEDDANEEMIWMREGDNKSFYFFKDDELWKIVRAYDPKGFEGKDFAKVVEDDWKKAFGPSPKSEKIKDTRSTDILLAYYEWQSSENGTVRAFDLSAVQGAYVLAVMDRGVEGRIGKRLPNSARTQGKVGGNVEGELKDVIGGSDVCYDEDGKMVESRRRCKEIRGF